MSDTPIGRSLARVDALAKATGAHVYPSDIVREGMLWVQVLRAPHPHARQQVRIALGAVAPTVMLATQAADLLMSERFDEDLLGRVANIAAAECSPIDDIRSTAAYRRKLVRGLLIRNLWPYLSPARRL